MHVSNRSLPLPCGVKRSAARTHAPATPHLLAAPTCMTGGQTEVCGIEHHTACRGSENWRPQLLVFFSSHVAGAMQAPNSTLVQLPSKQQLVHWQPHCAQQ